MANFTSIGQLLRPLHKNFPEFDDKDHDGDADEEFIIADGQKENAPEDEVDVAMLHYNEGSFKNVEK